ncbi:MAG: translation elongation factor Ts [Candidatus Kerfeldbacteria bacterium]|nr:translation elongation factor Ts [Candidatus Kerfeldbacteria bacterium]
MAVDTKLIARLREQTGAGVLDAKKALQEASDDYDKAVEILRKRGQKVAAKKADRVASEGLVEAYVHGQGRVGVLVKVNCETDFVARTDKFKELAHQLALHIAAFDPTYINSSDVPADVIAKEKDVYLELLTKEGKPADAIEKIMVGKLNKYFSEVCLLNQAFVMDDKRSVQDIINEKIAELGENIQVSAFKRITL